MPLHPGLKGKGGKGGKTKGGKGMGKGKQAPAATPVAEEVEHVPVPRNAAGVRFKIFPSLVARSAKSSPQIYFVHTPDTVKVLLC